MSSALGTVGKVRGGIGPSRWTRPVLAGLLALLFLLLLLLGLDKAGGETYTSDVLAAIVVALIIGAGVS